MSRTQKLVEAAMLAAVAFIIDIIFKQIPILQMPQGGSFSLALLPIVIAAIRLGPGHGVMVGAIFGFLNFLSDGYAFSPYSIFLDYLFACGVMGLVGIFKKQCEQSLTKMIVFGVIGIAVFGTIKFWSHVLSGVVAFDTELWASMVYNAGYCYASLLGVAMVYVLISPAMFTLLKHQRKSY